MRAVYLDDMRLKVYESSLLEDVRLKVYVSSLPGRHEAKGVCEQFTWKM